MLQRTDEWYQSRLGRFTASDIYRLLGKETLKTTKQSIDTFAFEKAVETVFGKDEENIISFDMQRGIDLEPIAFERFKELKSYDFLDVKEVGFIKYKKHAGSSPDGLVSDNSNLEIKCPRRNKFFKIVANGVSEIDFKYIAQMQMQMLSLNSHQTHFFNFYIEKGIEYWHELIINRDEEMINLIDKRIEIATEIKLDYIEKIKQNQQW